MERAPEALDQWSMRRHDIIASIPRGWVILGLAVMAWILLTGMGLVVWALLT